MQSGHEYSRIKLECSCPVSFNFLQESTIFDSCACNLRNCGISLFINSIPCLWRELVFVYHSAYGLADLRVSYEF